MLSSPTLPLQQAGAAPRVHLAYLDSLRALAALSVIIGHAWITIWPPEYGKIEHGWPVLFRWLLFLPHPAVDLFIVISGFCLMLPVVRQGGMLRGGAWLFFKKRARRILPPYYAALAISFALVLTLIGHKTGTHWDGCIPWTKRGLLADILLLQDVFGTQINHALWSIAVEWHIYFFFPLLVWAWRKVGGLWATFLISSIGYTIFFFVRHTDYVTTTPWYLALFGLGTLGAAVAFSPEARWSQLRRQVPWGAASVSLILLYAALCLTKLTWVSTHIAYADFLIGLCAMCALIALSRTKPRAARRLLESRPLVFVGTFSYSIYLIHAPLIQVIWQYLLHPLHLSDNLTCLLLVLGGGPAIVGISYLFFLLCERPFLSGKNQKAAVEIVSDAASLELLK